SDPTGSFSNGFKYIGSVADTMPGTFTIDATIPASAGASTHYRFRILAASPYFTSTDNGSHIAIGTAPQVPGIGSSVRADSTGTWYSVRAGSTGESITFGAGMSYNNGDLNDIAFWDFGSGATPATATTPGIEFRDSGDHVISFLQDVTYSTPGDKMVTLRVVNSEGCSTSLTYELHIYGCTFPSIPHDAIVVGSVTIAASGRTYWINPGCTLLANSSEVSYDTIFAEPGSTIAGSVYNCVLYMKHGSVLTSSSGYNSLIFGDSASINAASTDLTLNCPALDFDYSNAPPNPAHPSSSVKDGLISVPIIVSPNPTSGMISVQGLPSDNITVSVSNILGQVVMVQKNPPAPDFTLDLSKLVPGTYYIRFSSANSVVTKAIIKN
ncbi:MAG TPA: T9SS type A sorting domain-containing protein, partial [Candidatus Kapabacteria bacterium]|nr:T9SS type A sorting domain-containing protein [Candidatus Kapabacteria bacterium]